MTAYSVFSCFVKSFIMSNLFSLSNNLGLIYTKCVFILSPQPPSSTFLHNSIIIHRHSLLSSYTLSSSAIRTSTTILFCYIRSPPSLPPNPCHPLTLLSTKCALIFPSQTFQSHLPSITLWSPSTYLDPCHHFSSPLSTKHVFILSPQALHQPFVFLSQALSIVSLSPLCQSWSSIFSSPLIRLLHSLIFCYWNIYHNTLPFSVLRLSIVISLP